MHVLPSLIDRLKPVGVMRRARGEPVFLLRASEWVMGSGRRDQIGVAELVRYLGRSNG